MKNVNVGFIRPIGKKESFSDDHFELLEKKISEVIKSQSNSNYTFNPNGVVSEQQGVSDINRTIIKNILSTDIAIIIISGLNPNVMFELGLRASQKKPFIIVCDDETEFPFDIATFYIIKYPKNLNISDFEKFLEEFKRRFLGTWKSFESTGGEDTFISNFEVQTIINPTIDHVSLTEAVDKLSNMVDVMSKQYVSLKTDDNWDTFNFDHDIQLPNPNK